MDTAAPSHHRAPALAAACWWADQIITGATADVAPGDSAEDNLSNLLADGLRRRHPAPLPFQVAKFIATLAAAVEKNLAEFGYTVLGTDYQPDRTLAWAAQESDIHPDLLPLKTVTRISDDQVDANLGVSSPQTLVWPRQSADTDPAHLVKITAPDGSVWVVGEDGYVRPDGWPSFDR